MDRNQQIAAIDGWTELRSIHAILVGRNINGKFGPVPDYRAPENLHELVRIVEEKKIPITMENWHCKEWTVMMAVDTGLIAKHSTDLSHALAEAIVEAQG